MPNADEIRRETEERERLRRENQVAQVRRNGQGVIAALLSRLHELAHQITDNRVDQDLADAKQKDWASQHLEFTESKLSPAFLSSMSLALLAIYPAVYLIDLFLLSGNARHLAKDFAQGNQTLIYATIFLLPLAVLVFETGFQTQWAVADTRGQMWKWGIASVAMCFVVPSAIVGFSMATTPNNNDGAHSIQVQNWQLFGKAALAFFSHFAVLLGGKRLHEAKSYLIFKITLKRLERRANRLARQIRTDETTLTNTFTDYFQQLNDFNAARGARRIEAGPFDVATRSEINRAFGYEIIAAPPAQNPASDEDANNGGAADYTPPDASNQNDQPNGGDFNFDMDGEDEVRP